MLLERINLQKKLDILRNREIKQEELLEEVREILREAQTEQEILQRINQGDPDDIQSNDFNFDLLESGRIYHISQIKKICIQYRLRFLNTRY